MNAFNALTLALMTWLRGFQEDERGDLFSQWMIIALVGVLCAGAVWAWQSGLITWLGEMIKTQIQTLLTF